MVTCQWGMRTLVASGVLASLISVAQADDALDRAQIQAGIQTVKAKVMACGNGAKIGGKISIRATVDAQGKVTAADATGEDTDVGTCVAGVIKTAVFAKTASGGTFSYPFIFPKTGADDTTSKRAGKTPSKPKSDGALPEDPLGKPPQTEGLDRAAITAGIAKVKTKVMACKGTGKIKVNVKVAPDGKVTSATAEPADKLGQCAAAAVKTAVFAKSDQGGSFTYPFVFGTPATTSPPPAGDALDRAAISDGIAKVKAKVSACGKGVTAKGKVQIKVTVAPDGRVTSADVAATPDQGLGTCVAGVIKAATFKATAQGGSFSYPFVF